ncbi:unnamed protein product, partial [Symbiodinium sp. CCMP2456]
MAIVPVAEPAASDNQGSWWAGLHEEWENTPLLRERMRKGLHLLIPHPLCKDDSKPSPDFVERSVHNCRQNKDVLIPAMKRWAAHGPETVPQVDCLYHEVEKLFQTCYREDLTPGDTHMDAWTLRKLMTLVKSLLSKNNPPRDAIMAEIFLAFGYEITVREHLEPSEEPEVLEPAPVDLMDVQEEHSESEDEREEDALMDAGDIGGDGLPLDTLPLGEASKIASERREGRPVATPQMRSCNPPQVEVPPAPVATQSYEHLGSLSSLCDAFDGNLHIGETDAPEESLDGECIAISDEEEAPPINPEKDVLLRRLHELQKCHEAALRLRATPPTDTLPSVPAPPLSLTGSAMDAAETQIQLEEPLELSEEKVSGLLEPTEDEPAEAPEPIEEKPSEEPPEPIEEKPSEEPVEDALLSGLPDLGVWDGVSRRDQHSMVAARKEARAAKRSKKNEGDAGETKVKSILKKGKSLRRIKGIKKRLGKAKLSKRAKAAKGTTLASEP